MARLGVEEAESLECEVPCGSEIGGRLRFEEESHLFDELVDG